MLELVESIRRARAGHAITRHAGDGAGPALHFELGVVRVSVLAGDGEAGRGAGDDAPSQRPAAVAGADAVNAEVEVSVGALGAEVVDDGLERQPACAHVRCEYQCEYESVKTPYNRKVNIPESKESQLWNMRHPHSLEWHHLERACVRARHVLDWRSILNQKKQQQKQQQCNKDGHMFVAFSEFALFSLSALFGQQQQANDDVQIATASTRP